MWAVSWSRARSTVSGGVVFLVVVVGVENEGLSWDDGGDNKGCWLLSLWAEVVVAIALLAAFSMLMGSSSRSIFLQGVQAEQSGVGLRFEQPYCLRTEGLVCVQRRRVSVVAIMVILIFNTSASVSQGRADENGWTKSRYD